jgi:hypothetical protein
VVIELLRLGRNKNKSYNFSMLPIFRQEAGIVSYAFTCLKAGIALVP